MEEKLKIFVKSKIDENVSLKIKSLEDLIQIKEMEI